MTNLTLTFLSFLTVAASAASAGSDWPGPRGPHDNGSGDASLKLPAKFSPDENVKWEVDLPGPSAATPCVVGGRVFIPVAVEDKQVLRAVCLDAKSGKTIWQKDAVTGRRTFLDDRSNLASPSPVSDGKYVVFYFGTGDIFVYTLDGEEVWKKNVIGSDDYYFAFQWTYSTSPLLYDGSVIIQVLQRDTSFSFADYQRGKPDVKENPSYLVAFDIANGRQLWKKERKSDAVAESREAFTTPSIAQADGRDILLVCGGDAITGHNPKNGKELWRWGEWNPTRIGHWRLVPSPVGGDGIALACAPKQSPVYGVDMKTGNLVWTSEDKEVSSDVATPLFYKGHFWVLNGDFKDKRLSCVEPKSGKVLWTGEIGTRAKIESSPHAADGKIYFLDHNGTVFVVAADTGKFALLNRAEFGSRKVKNMRSSIALANDNLFIRTHDKLYCIGG